MTQVVTQRRAFCMNKYKLIVILGITSYILGVIFSTTDLSGNYTSPTPVIILSGLTYLLYFLAVVKLLWQNERKATVVYITTTVLLSLFILMQTIFSLNHAGFTLLVNIVKIMQLVVALYVFSLLWTMAKSHNRFDNQSHVQEFIRAARRAGDKKEQVKDLFIDALREAKKR